MDGCAYQLLPQGLLTDSPLDSHTNLALPLPSRLAHLMLLAANTRQELSFAVGMHRGPRRILCQAVATHLNVGSERCCSVLLAL